MRIGIDFGTSYTAAAAFKNDKVVPIRFGDDRQFRTAVFFPESVPDLRDFVLDTQQEAAVDAMVRVAKSDQRRAVAEAEKRRRDAGQIKDEVRRKAALALIVSPIVRGDDALRREAVSAVRRQWIEQQVRSAKGNVGRVENALFGEDAIDAYLSEGTGSLVESPKSMLGYKLDPRPYEAIVSIISHILQHVRLQATRQLKTSVRSAVIGRPVQFRTTMGEEGNTQGLSILHAAALRAGFDDVEFFEEPAAAAMHYHSVSKQTHRALVIDIGGGTTDLAFADVGGNLNAPRVHAVWGLPKGGTDFDLGLSLSRFMPLFGYGEGILPAHHFVAAASVHDNPRQQEFKKHRYHHLAAPFGDRLAVLQRLGMTTRLNRVVERMKIFLSENTQGRVRLGFIEKGLIASAAQDDLREGAARYLKKLEELFDEARRQIEDPIDAIFLTGGMSRAPIIQTHIAASFPNTKLILGDPSFGVVSGLGVRAANG